MVTFNRRRLLQSGIAAAGAFGLAGVARADISKSTLTVAPFVEVEIADGKLKGGTSRGALSFKGIPYGGSVSGANRFKEAPPVQPWTGVRDATQLGAPSLQKPHSTYGENEPAYAEDCLFLNVWTPAADGKKRPVMVYCHGGGYSTGSAGSTAQDGSRLAATYDVVVVASNHRLGLLGYLYLGELGGADYATSGNQGMLDIVAALRWVKTNITAFGGDPDNVMIFGESGGGFKTGTLLAMPAAHGLFHKCSIESGAAPRRMEKDAATETARRVLKGLGIAPNDLGKLADVPGQAFVDMQLAIEQGKGPLMVPSDQFRGTTPVFGPLHEAHWNAEQAGSFGPVVDGTVLPVHPFDPVAAPISAHIPLLIGHNRDEATFFNMGRPDTFSMDEAALKARLTTEFADSADRIYATYRQMRPKASPSDLYIAIASARWFGNGTTTCADRKAAQPAPVYCYRDDYESNFPIMGTNTTLKAGHATEIALKFFNYDLPGLQGNGPGVEAASANTSAFWTSFARHGVPSAPGAPKWPRYGPKKRAVMLIDVKCHVENDPDGPARKMWQTVPS